MNALKKKMDDTSQHAEGTMRHMHTEQLARAAALEAELQAVKEQSLAHQRETHALKQEALAVNSKLSEILQLLQSQSQR
jgi:hypothetical protein